MAAVCSGRPTELQQATLRSTIIFVRRAVGVGRRDACAGGDEYLIYVCDALMGQGKSSAAIKYMNEHPKNKFIYISPYLDESARIKNGCPELDFVEPGRLSEYNGSKLEHTFALIEEGRNIATTHQAFKNYTEETLDAIRRYHYTMIIDESLDILETCSIADGDMDLLLDAKYINFDGTRYELARDDYTGRAFKDIFWYLRSRHITEIVSPEGGKKLFYWILSPELFEAFDDVYILTYLFEGQSLHSFMQIYDIGYQHIGVQKVGDEYEFCDQPGNKPEYARHIRDMIEVVEDEKLNAIGDDETALSKSWFSRNRGNAVKRLKDNIYNVFRNIWDDSDACERMWSTFKSSKEALKGKGYTNGFGVLNLKSSNKYRNRKYLVYACNIYMNVAEKTFYEKNGISVNDELYALSIMLQWIWRSAIRDGQKIYIYLPSSRMRRILYNWMDSLTEGGGDIASEDM